MKCDLCGAEIVVDEKGRERNTATAKSGRQVVGGYHYCGASRVNVAPMALYKKPSRRVKPMPPGGSPDTRHRDDPW